MLRDYVNARGLENLQVWLLCLMQAYVANLQTFQVFLCQFKTSKVLDRRILDWHLLSMIEVKLKVFIAY